jgi:hypothetical protein
LIQHGCPAIFSTGYIDLILLPESCTSYLYFGSFFSNGGSVVFSPHFLGGTKPSNVKSALKKYNNWTNLFKDVPVQQYSTVAGFLFRIKRRYFELGAGKKN